MKKWIPGWVAKGWGAVRRVWGLARESRIAGWAARLWGWIVCAWGHVVRFWQWARPLVAEHGVALSVVPLILALVLASVFWEWLTVAESGTDPVSESGSTTVRNLGIVLAGLIALPLAVWRAQVADRQACAAELTLLNDRYQRGVERMHSDVLSDRLAGIDALRRLAEDHPQEYHVQIMQVLCAYLRNRTKEGGMGRDRVREDLQAALETIYSCHRRQFPLEKEAEFRLDLRGVDLRGPLIISGNLSDAVLTDAILTRVFLFSADLAGAHLMGAHLVGATLTGAQLIGAKLSLANLTDASLMRANLTGADFAGFLAEFAIGVTQEQLDVAIADPDNPPKLEGVRDAETGKQLVWRGKTPDGQPHPKPDDAPDD